MPCSARHQVHGGADGRGRGSAGTPDGDQLELHHRRLTEGLSPSETSPRLAPGNLYAALTVFWRPLSGTVVPVLAPLGQATLYVFVLQVFAVLIVANIPLPSTTPVFWGTLVHTAVLVGMWLMVRHRVLFRVIPR